MATEQPQIKRRKAGAVFYPIGIDGNGKLSVDDSGQTQTGSGLNGKDGAPGRDGSNGVNGRDGTPGRDGANGKDGVNGKDGINGIDGVDGLPGKDGINGTNGTNGKDGKDGSTVKATATTLGGVIVPGSNGIVADIDGRVGIDYTLFGEPIYGRSKGAIQAAIASATPGKKFLLFGEYDFTQDVANPLLITKNVQLNGLNGTVFNGGDKAANLVKIYGITDGLTLSQIKFSSLKTGKDYAMVYCNEQGDINNLLLDRCEFYGPNGRFNAFGMNAWASNTAKATFDGVTLRSCIMRKMGRMGGEFLAHANDGVARIKNVVIDNCTVDQVGLYNVPNDNDIHGMGWSFSGDIVGLTMTSPIVTDSLLGIELICTRQFTITNPRLTGFRSKTDQDGTNGSLGISLTDGGNSDRGNPGRYPTDGIISGGYINVNGRGVNGRFIKDVTFNGGNWRCGQWNLFQHGSGARLHGVDIECSSQNYITQFENHKEAHIDGGVWSRRSATQGPFYEPIALDGNCSGIVQGVDIRTNGNSDNYYGSEPYNKNYLYSPSATVYWQNIYWNGKKQADNV